MTAITTEPGTHWTPAHYGQGVALFDLDRTLVPGSSLSVFGRRLLAEGLISRRQVARFAAWEQLFRRRGLGDGRVDALVRGLLEMATGYEAGPLSQVASSIGQELVGLMSPTARFLVEHHLRAGDFCIIVSASPQELVEAVTSALGTHRAVGTRLGVSGGRLTGRIDGHLCYGTGKLDCLEREVGRLDLQGATAYADSGSDLPLLERCGSPVAVNPDGELRNWARTKGWPIIRY